MTANQRIRLGMAISAVLIVIVLVWLARGGLAPFFLGAILAYLISPVVGRISQLFRMRWPNARWARVAAILTFFVVVFGIVAGIAALVIPPLIDSVQELVDEQDRIIASVRERVDEWLDQYNREVPESVQEWIDTAVANASDSAGDWVGSIAGSVATRVVSSIVAVIGFFVVPVWLFMVLKDHQRISRGFYGLFPFELRGDVRYMMRDADRVLGNYLRAILILAVVVGLITYVGLFLLDAPFAVALAIIAGVGEMIPIVGPIIATLIAVAVVMALDPGITAVWVLLLYIGVQQVQNMFLAPKIHGSALRIHPALIIMLVLIGGELFGTIGMALTPPLFAITRNSFLYVYKRLDGMPRPSAAAEANEAARQARLEAAEAEALEATPGPAT